MQLDAVQLDFFSADPNNRPMLLSSIGEGIRNDCGVVGLYITSMRTDRMNGLPTMAQVELSCKEEYK